MGFGLIIAVLGLGSTFAADITINQDPNTEFGQGVTKTVYCGADNDEEESITVTPLSKFANESNYQRMTAPEVRGQAEVSYTYRFATSVNNSSSSDFISSNQATKVINGRTGVWLTNNGSNGQIASNQDETTFSSSNRSDYVFSQNATTKRINNSDVRGFYKVNNTTSERIVITPAIASRSAQYTTETNPTEFYFSGLVISDIPDNCEGKDFIVSGYGQTGNAQTLINLGEESVNEITALWTGDDNDTPRVSKSRIRYVNISNNVDASQDDGRLELVFGRTDATNYLKTEDLYRLVIETQEDTLSSNNDGNDD
jgi:hypothetical protein